MKITKSKIKGFKPLHALQNLDMVGIAHPTNDHLIVTLA
jgi:hypothetical protein